MTGRSTVTMGETNNQINMRTLKRIDAGVKEIAISAGQVAVYKFVTESNEWVRLEIEGSMFVVRRSVAPLYGLIVINRLSTDNMIQKIGHNVETNLQEPYLMVRNEDGQILCIWFYNSQDCVKVYKKLKENEELAPKKTALQQSPFGGFAPQQISSPIGGDPHSNDQATIFQRLFPVVQTTEQTVSGAGLNRQLTMEQLKQTLVHLLQNDADFLHSIHTTYITKIRK